MMRNLSLVRTRVALFFSFVAIAAAGSAQAGTLVTFNTNMGNFQVDMFDEVVGTTVANFVSLVNGGNYSNTIVHRSEAYNFVIQGGGFNTSYAAIANNGNIALQYKMLNTRGTIAMARTNSPNTANSQWFINTVDNSTVLAPRADNPATPNVNEFSDGYAAFGWVVKGMNVVDAIEALPVFDKRADTGNGALNTLPLQNYTSGAIADANKVIITSVTIAESHPSFQNPIWDTDVNNDGNLNASDLMPIVNRLLAHDGRFTPAAADINNTYYYFDTNGDNQVAVADLMRVVNAILRNDGPPASPQAAPDAMPMAVPEPSSLALIAMAIVATLTVAIRRRRSRAAS
jgi:cyclophilin family peptidyl-prolyl cis-trans isomerase